MVQWPLFHVDVDVSPAGSVPGGPIGSPAAGCDRRSIPTQYTCPHQPNEARSALGRAPGTLASWRRIGLLAARLASVCWPVRPRDHDDGPRHLLDGPIVEWYEPSILASERPAPVSHPGEQLQRQAQEPAGALTVGVVVLVPPNLLGFFFEN